MNFSVRNNSQCRLHIGYILKNLLYICSVGNVVFSYLAILASCFKIVLAKLELHLPSFSIVFFPKYTAEITVQNIKINCCKIRPRLENYDFLTFTFLPYIKSGTYKVRNEIETKRNETKSMKTKRNEINKNETKSTK